jgi:predicted nucleic acid-binding protein
VIIFFDTSVLVAAFQGSHVHHEQSNCTLASVGPKQGACGAHSLAEFYSVTTRLPIPHRLEPDQSLLCVEQIAEHFQLVALDTDEYLAEIRRAVANGIAGGRMYDALLLACARKAKADRILTWNIRDFRLLAPDLADRIVTP